MKKFIYYAGIVSMFAVLVCSSSFVLYKYEQEMSKERFAKLMKNTYGEQNYGYDEQLMDAYSLYEKAEDAYIQSGRVDGSYEEKMLKFAAYHLDNIKNNK